jgi:hypothetical protein
MGVLVDLIDNFVCSRTKTYNSPHELGGIKDVHDSFINYQRKMKPP